MPTKTYTNSSNCSRAAKKALGSTAKAGTDFLITSKDGAYTWAPIVKTTTKVVAGAAPRKRVKGEAKLQDQPQMVKLLAAMRKPEGATIQALSALLGGVAEHTVRASISRLRGEGVTIDGTRAGKTNVYKVTT